MKLYIIRHGLTDWNKLKKIQGQTDIELNETGKNQALEAKKIFNEHDFDLIICSPLKRTKLTAEIINQDKKVKTIYSDALLERGLGLLEGQPTNMEVDSLYDLKLNTSENNVELATDFRDRVFNLLDEVKEKYFDKKVLLVTHGGTARAIEAYFYGINEDKVLPPETLKNCEIREYTFNN